MTPPDTSEPPVGLYEGIITTRAMRRYSDDPIRRDELEAILRAAQQGPSGGNIQPWQFVVVTDATVRRQLGEIYGLAYERYEAALLASMPPHRDDDVGGQLGAHVGGVPTPGRAHRRGACDRRRADARHRHDARRRRWRAGRRYPVRVGLSGRPEPACSPLGRWGSAVRSRPCTGSARTRSGCSSTSPIDSRRWRWSPSVVPPDASVSRRGGPPSP